MKENVIIGKIIPAGTGMARYRNMEPKEVGVASENVYSISDIEAQMAAEDAMKTSIINPKSRKEHVLTAFLFAISN